MIAEGKKQKRQSHFWPCLSLLAIPFGLYFLNFLLNPTSPTRPEPRRSMVVGSGTPEMQGNVKVSIPSESPDGVNTNFEMLGER